MAKTAQKRTSATGSRLRRQAATPEPVKQTKKQIALGRKQARQNRIIWLSVAGLALLIVLILAIGLSQEFLVKPGKPVAIVNGTKIRADDYRTMLNYTRYNLHANIRQLESWLSGMDTSQEGTDFLVSFYQQQLEQLKEELSAAPDTALEQMIDDALVREKAKEVGITVTAADVQQNIEEQIQQAATQSAQTAISDTQEITPTAVPREQLDQIYQDALDRMNLSDKEYRRIVEAGLYRTRLQEVLASQVATTGLVIHVQMIVTDTQEVAQAAKNRIDGGEDFSTVAKEISGDYQVQENGGDLGWVTTGQLSSRYGQAMEDLAFSLSVGQSGVVESNSKFYVVKVLERNENGPLPDEVLGQRRNNALSDWLTERKSAPDVTISRLLQTDQIPPDPFAES